MKGQKMRQATPGQISIAVAFKIPLRQAHTINGSKFSQYLKHLSTPLARLERWFDEQENRRILERGDYHHGCQ